VPWRSLSVTSGSASAMPATSSRVTISGTPRSISQ
jgi:hypothetical protein